MNEEGGHWTRISEHVIEQKVDGFFDVSSPHEFLLVLGVEDDDDFNTFIYQYDTNKYDLNLRKKFNSHHSDYLYVPDFLFV